MTVGRWPLSVSSRSVELIAGTGFYVMIAMTLNAFDVAVPGGEKPLPP